MSEMARKLPLVNKLMFYTTEVSDGQSHRCRNAGHGGHLGRYDRYCQSRTVHRK